MDNNAPFGGYFPLADLDDSLYQEVYQFVIGKYDLLLTKTVESVRYQIVQGTNFMIEFTNYPFSHDIYVVIAHKPLGATAPHVDHIYKNGVDIHNTIVTTSSSILGAFNYEADTEFKGLY